MNLDELVNFAKTDSVERNNLIASYTPFVIKTVSEVTGAYVAIGDSDELSIGLLAFNEAIDRYDATKSHFLTYAKLVISSRLLTYMAQLEKHTHIGLDEVESLPALGDETSYLKDEISQWKDELKWFRINFEQLVIESPKHTDTRLRAIALAEEASNDKLIVNRLYEKFKLPVSMIHKRFTVSIKIIERSKVFITAVMIVFVKELGAIKLWIKKI